MDVDKSKLTHVKRGAVLGAGTMGGGIAWLFANNNQAPLMKDINTTGLELGLKQASSVFGKAKKRRRLSADDFERKMRSIEPTMSYDGFKGVDLVIEAVVENMDIKKKVFAETEKHVRKDCLLTSNTSSLSVEEMASALEKPERFAGLHFFNPVNRMPLVEIIKHSKVSQETIDSLYNWCLKVKKTPVVVGDGPGFLVNRILMPFINESAYLLEEGVSIEALDKAVSNFGMPMGTCRLMDEIGIDVLVKVGKIMEDGLGARAKSCQLSAKMTEGELLGKKNGKGFYLYEGGKQKGVNPEALKYLPQNKKKMDETTIQMRVFLPMINEAANILADGIVDKAEAVDLGLIYGIGFPPFREWAS
jgi:3-hydroxyacyl-CoA dehydrogenase/enoyl-CoA hydratase/3-hydroxybutyryl-CoA epimerase